MGPLRLFLILGAVLALIVGFIVMMATPGSVVTTRYASGEPVDREMLAALIGLLVLGLAAIGFDFEA